MDDEPLVWYANPRGNVYPVANEEAALKLLETTYGYHNYVFFFANLSTEGL